MSDEVFDILDDSGRLLGRASRAEVHAAGLWHRTAHVWVILPPGNENPDEGMLLFQRRSATKDVAPNMIDVSVGGHLAAGEEPLSAAYRELAEELGLHPAPDRLRLLGVRQTAGIFGELIDREFQTLYAVEESRPLVEFRVQASEIASLVGVPIGRGLALFAGEVSAIEVPTVRVSADGATEPRTERVTLAEFVPSVDRYFYRACVMARRWLRGEDHLVL